MARIVVLTGAGISAESGIKTFRDADGLWEGYDVMEVASPEGWHRNQQLVLDFYNARRKQLLEVRPNPAHYALAELAEHFEVDIITQNIDDLHERAGSKRVLHLHGELLKARSSADPSMLYPWKKDILLGDKCEMGYQLRPHVVWFGEPVPMMEPAIELVLQSDMLLVVGTSLQVYPAAGLLDFAQQAKQIIYIDPKPAAYSLRGDNGRLITLQGNAGEVLPELVSRIIEEMVP